jgi:tRNA(Ile)-lysidine synthase
VKDKSHASFSRTLPVPGEVTIPEAELHVACDWHHGAVKQSGAKLGQWPAEVTLRADRLAASRISLRSWKPGNRIRPLGMEGTKKIQDLFVDEKIPKDLRWRIPVMEAEGEIIWVPGYQVARGWDVRSSEDRSLHVRIDAAP